MYLRLSSIFIVLTLLFVGCASYKIEKVSKDDESEGYYCYKPVPYLIQSAITKDGATVGYKFEIVYLPNYNEKYKITTSNFLAKADFSFSFRDGWLLENIGDKSDNSGVLTTLIETVGGMIKSTDSIPKEPVFYSFVFGKDGKLAGLQKVTINTGS